MKDDYRLYAIGAIAFAFLALFLWLNRSLPAPKTNETVAVVRNEAERLERLAGLVDDKVKAEVKNNEKIAVPSDDVLPVLDGLLSRSQR